MQTHDYVVIGAGSGGLASARRAARHGAKVALVAGGPLGGTCVNSGCVPKKILWNAAECAEWLADAPDYGFEVRTSGVDWAELKRVRDAYIQRLGAIYARNIELDGIELVTGYARFSSADTVQVGDRQLGAKAILIATGGRPSVPAVPGAELGSTSDDFFELQQRPARVSIAGAGYIAV